MQRLSFEEPPCRGSWRELGSHLHVARMSFQALAFSRPATPCAHVLCALRCLSARGAFHMSSFCAGAADSIRS